MRLLRLEHHGDPYFAQWVDDATARLWTDAPWHGGEASDRLVPLGRTRLLAPVQPGKVLCVGRNYAAHAAELGNAMPKEPLLFLKSPGSIVGPEDAITLPVQSGQVEYEGEIGVVVARPLKNADLDAVRRAIYGITAVNDVTARDVQRAEGQFTRAKSFDSFCPVGPWIDTELSPDDLTVWTRINGEERQHGHTSEMAFPILELVAFMSRQMSLLPGDLISTGTPAGVGPLKPGDVVEIEVSGLGTLRNRVQAPPDSHMST